MTNQPPRISFPKSFGMVLLCLWLIATGLLAVTNLSIDGAPTILGFMALLAGILLVLGI